MCCTFVIIRFLKSYFVKIIFFNWFLFITHILLISFSGSKIKTPVTTPSYGSGFSHQRTFPSLTFIFNMLCIRSQSYKILLSPEFDRFYFWVNGWNLLRQLTFNKWRCNCVMSKFSQCILFSDWSGCGEMWVELTHI